jgi:hypothetical protein
LHSQEGTAGRSSRPGCRHLRVGRMAVCGPGMGRFRLGDLRPRRRKIGFHAVCHAGAGSTSVGVSGKAAAGFRYRFAAADANSRFQKGVVRLSCFHRSWFRAVGGLTPSGWPVWRAIDPTGRHHPDGAAKQSASAAKRAFMGAVPAIGNESGPGTVPVASAVLAQAQHIALFLAFLV